MVHPLLLRRSQLLPLLCLPVFVSHAVTGFLLPAALVPRRAWVSPAAPATPRVTREAVVDGPTIAAGLTAAGIAVAFKVIEGQRRASLKSELLAAVAKSQRGADESKNAGINKLFAELEGLNPTGEPLGDQLKGDWELLWTTSTSILGLGRPPFFRPLQDRPILQYLDPGEGVARNLEFTPLGPNRVEAEILPLGPEQREAFVSRLDDFLLFKQGSEESAGGTYLPKVEGLEKTTVGVRFKVFTLFGLLPIQAPESATGILQVTYLDEDLRLSRGDRGNLFVLRKVSSNMSA
mmetsp:Transcript_5308/g.9507  ORF Transcript_5308/g.9507 Transcript_5308/m.9507 type:complete len:292 (-) Transcript_5308:25-900(-)